MNRSTQLKNLERRVICLLIVMFVYFLGSAIPIPDAHMTASFAKVMRESPLGLLSLMGGTNLQQLSLFSVGINPLMITMIIIQVLSMTRLFGFDSLSQQQTQFIQQFLALILAAIQSTTLTLGLHLSTGMYHQVSTIIILTAGSMFVTWLGDMNSRKGIGGTLAIILINIIVGMLPRLQSAIHSIEKLSHPTLWLIALGIVSIGILYFWIAFNYAYYPVQLVDISFDSRSKPVILPIGLNMGAMMTYMMGMGLISLPMLLGQIFKIKLITSLTFMTTYSFIITFLLFYFFTFMQFNPKQEAKALRNQNSYILNVRPGKPTQRYLRKRVLLLSLPGAFLNSIQLAFGMVGNKLLGAFSGIAFIPMVTVMIVMFMFGIKDIVLTLLIPYRYEKIIKKAE